MEKHTLHTLENVLTYTVAGILIFFLLLLPLDTYEFLNNSADYIKVYHFDTSQAFWQLQYFGPTLMKFSLALIGLIIIIMSLKNKNNRILKNVKRLVVFLTFAFIIYGFYDFYSTGFDH